VRPENWKIAVLQSYTARNDVLVPDEESLINKVKEAACKLNPATNKKPRTILGGHELQLNVEENGTNGGCN
jgi:hypothetical protein